MKTNIQKCPSILGAMGCLGAVLLSSVSVRGQTIYAEVASNGIYEVSGGTVTTTPISDVGTGGLALDSSGDIFFVNNGNVVSEYTSGGVQETLGLPLAPVYAPSGFTIVGIDNQGNLWGTGQEGLYSTSASPFAPPLSLSEAGASAATVNSAGQVFFEYSLGISGTPYPIDIYQRINGVTLSLVYQIGPTLSAMAFDNSGDLFGINFTGPSGVVEFTPGGGENVVTGAPSNPTCLALDNAGDLFVGCSNGDIDEITTGGSESTVATLDGPVEGLVVVPEPSSLGIFGVGAIALILRKVWHKPQ